MPPTHTRLFKARDSRKLGPRSTPLLFTNCDVPENSDLFGQEFVDKGGDLGGRGIGVQMSNSSWVRVRVPLACGRVSEGDQWTTPHWVSWRPLVLERIKGMAATKKYPVEVQEVSRDGRWAGA